MMKRYFFGYLSKEVKIIVRVFSISFILLSPILYYKRIEGVFLEDIIKMLWYSFSFEVLHIWIFSLIVINLISIFIYIVFQKTNK